MAEIVWTGPAYRDLDEITEYIGFDNPEAADALAERIFGHVRQLEKHPESGPVPPELIGANVRQIVEPPCRVFYSFDGKIILILHVLRFERVLRVSRLGDRE